MDRLEAMKIFIRVAELKSFTKAAESLNLPKASVSTYIQNLEILINAKLLNRTTRHVELTPEGTSYYKRCKDIIYDIDETESMFNNDNNIKGKIRIDMSVRIASSIIIPIIHQFLEKYPNIEIELSTTDHKVDLIKEGIDCVIRGFCASGTANIFEAGLVEKNLGQMISINCVSPKYIDKYGIPTTLNDLKNHKLIYYTNTLGSKPNGFEYFENGKHLEFKMSGIITVNNTDSYLSACLAGLGIAQIPSTGVKHFLKSGELIEIIPELKAGPFELKLVYPYRKKPIKRLSVFIDWLQPILINLLK